MSKRHKRRTRAAEKDVATRQESPEAPSPKEVASASKPVANGRRRYGLALLIVAGALWAGWFAFLVYVAFNRS